MDTLKLLRGDDLVLGPFLTVRHPTLNEICDYGEARYFSLVSALTSSPSDYKVALYDAGIDYCNCSHLELFYSLCRDLQKEETAILFSSLDFTKLRPAKDKNGKMLLAIPSADIIIDESLREAIASHIRKIHGLAEPEQKLPGNEATKEILIRHEREKLLRRQRKSQVPILSPLVSAMVNCADFKYDHKGVWDLTIYNFMDSVRRIQKMKNCGHLLQGVYTGAIDLSGFDTEKLNWMGEL